jgi:DNA topoisomerase I
MRSVGWRYESVRHGLAARGISSSRYLSVKHDYRIRFKPVNSKKYDMELVGVDRKGRRVRKYGEEHWKEADREKYGRVFRLKREYGEVMKRLRKDMFSEDADVRKNARAAYIMAKTGMRPGTRKDMKADQMAYGVTTLKKEHVKASGDDVRFNFTGKHGIPVHMHVKDGLMAKAVNKQKSEVQGKELFPSASDATVRNYLYKHGEFKPKDFRTLKANHIAEKMVSAGVSKQKVTEAVAKQLANTPKVSEHSYINPSVWRK